MDYGVAPEASSAAEAWLKKHDGVFKLFIDGAWADTAKHFDSTNPATAKKLGAIAEASVADVDLVPHFVGETPGFSPALVEVVRVFVISFEPLTDLVADRFDFGLLFGS